MEWRADFIAGSENGAKPAELIFSTKRPGILNALSLPKSMGNRRACKA
jgi:hypothetical protein